MFDDIGMLPVMPAQERAAPAVAAAEIGAVAACRCALWPPVVTLGAFGPSAGTMVPTGGTGAIPLPTGGSGPGLSDASAPKPDAGCQQFAIEWEPKIPTVFMIARGACSKTSP